MKRNLIIALVLGIFIPWILIFIFLTLLTDINWTLLSGGFPQTLAILTFASVAFPYNVPIFGYGYVIPLFIWILTGLFCGLLCRSTLKGALITLIGLFVNIILFSILNLIDPSFIPTSLQTVENIGLLSGFSLDFIISLGLFLFWYALILPGGVLGGILGGMISRTGITS